MFGGRLIIIVVVSCRLIIIVVVACMVVSQIRVVILLHWVVVVVLAVFLGLGVVLLKGLIRTLLAVRSSDIGCLIIA